MPSRSSRRQFLAEAGIAGASVVGLSALLSACSNSSISFSPTPTNTPNNLQSHWQLANAWGIRVDATGQHWGAGHINAIEEIDAHTLLTASDSGGVWFLTDGGVGTPLSLDWDSPDMRTLTRGPLSERHYYAGGISGTDASHGALYMSNPTADLGVLADWISIPLLRVGAISKIVVAQDPTNVSQHNLVLATSNGIWWSVIPAATDGTGYVFQLAAATGSFNAADSFYSLALVANTAIVAGAAVSGSIGYGTWTGGHLTLTASAFTPPSFAASSMRTISLATTAANPRVIYALSSGADDRIYAVLCSEDGGNTFQQRTASLVATPPATLQAFAGTQGSYNNVIAISPTNPNTLAIAWVNGPFLSLNGAATFSPASGDHLVGGHQDFHAMIFSTLVPGRVYCGSDGGVIAWENLGNATANPDNSINFVGVTIDTLYNRHLANLQFQGPTGREYQGTISASYQTPGMVGGGLQDNNVVYSNITGDLGTTTPWQSLIAGASDGENCLFLYQGGMLYRGNATDATYVAVSGIQPGTQTLVPVRRQKPQTSLPSLNGTIDIVNAPHYQDDEGQMMYALGTQGGTADVYGLFAHLDGSDIHWNYLTTVTTQSNTQVVALNSGSGALVFVGTDTGQIFRFDPAHPSIITPTSGLPTSATVVRIIVHTDAPGIDAYALLNNDHGHIVHTTNGTTWTEVAGNGLPHLPFYDFVSDWTTSPPVQITASDNAVFASRDNGGNWENISNGLPRRAHCNTLRFVTQPDGKYLYLGTFGWSMWRTHIV